MINDLSNVSCKELNAQIHQSLSSLKSDETCESKQETMQANRIWNEIRKELTDLSKKGKLRTKNVATIEYIGNGRVSILYQKQACKEFKMYDIGADTNFQQVIFRIGILAEQYHFNLYPLISRMHGRNADWCIEFTVR